MVAEFWGVAVVSVRRSIPNNTGDEIVLYAKFIVDHFDSLPSRMIFAHAHETSWHQRVTRRSLLNSNIHAHDTWTMTVVVCDTMSLSLLYVQNMSEILRRLDVTAYDFVGFSERFFREGQMCRYGEWIQSVFKRQPRLKAELGQLPGNVSDRHAPVCRVYLDGGQFLTSMLAGTRRCSSVTRRCSPVTRRCE